jgi:hypothetical protein
MAAQTKPPEEGTLKKSEAQTREGVQPVVVRPEAERVLFSWKAPARPFKRRDRQFWMTLIAIAAILGLILFLIEGAMPVILIIALVFLFYVLSTVEPEEIDYQITNKGIRIADKRTNMGVLTRFWFTRRFNSELLVFEMAILPGRLEVVINPKDKGSIRKALSAYLSEEEAPPSGLDKAANWFAKKLPGNN